MSKLLKYIGKAKYDEFGSGYIWGINEKNEHEMLADIDKNGVRVRGWGAIQNMFKSEEEAEQFQDMVGRFVADAINEKIERDLWRSEP